MNSQNNFDDSLHGKNIDLITVDDHPSYNFNKENINKGNIVYYFLNLLLFKIFKLQKKS